MDFKALTQLIRQERLPAVIVDLDAFDRNVRRIAEMITSGVGTHEIRIATKSIRVPALIKRVLDSGAPYRSLMCFSTEEAAFLAAQGFDDLLIAYPTVQRSDLEILKKLNLQGRKVSLVVDELETVRRIDEFMEGATSPLRLILEVDASLRLFSGRVHLGVRRSPLKSARDVTRFLEQARSFSRVQISGVMVYEAQVAGLGDRNPVNRLLNPIIRLIRRISVRKVARLRKRIAASFRDLGLALDVFNGAGTGSISYAANEPWLTEITVGSGFLTPHLFDHYSNLDLEPAFYFALQVVRKPAPGWLTAAGGGYIASGKPGWDKVPIPVYPPDAKLNPEEGCGEVQTPLQTSQSEQIHIGDPVFFRHAKAGELAERFPEYLLVSQGRIVDRVKTYRGSGQCFF